MSHLPFIFSAYVLGILVPVAYAANAAMRFRGARRRLAAIDVRKPR